jgi:hypothetical protein
MLLAGKITPRAKRRFPLRFADIGNEINFLGNAPFLPPGSAFLTVVARCMSAAVLDILNFGCARAAAKLLLVSRFCSLPVRAQIGLPRAAAQIR